MELKTSEQWVKEKGSKILDPDGWDRKNFQFSFYEELISEQEFTHRLLHSTSLWFKLDGDKKALEEVSAKSIRESKEAGLDIHYIRDGIIYKESPEGREEMVRRVAKFRRK